MPFTNLENFVILGPGSEWFWAMAQFVVVVVTLAGIYFQLRAQAASNTLQRMQFMVDQWDSVEFSYDRLTTALHLRDGHATDRMVPSMLSIAGFFEQLGLLERRGHISRSEVFLLGRSIEMWWTLLWPTIERERLHQSANVYADFERLDGLVHAMDAKIGERYVIAPEAVTAVLDDVIRLNRGDLVRAQELADHVIPGDGASAAHGRSRRRPRTAPPEPTVDPPRAGV